jgi:hypothetical protein
VRGGALGGSRLPVYVVASWIARNRKRIEAVRYGVHAFAALVPREKGSEACLVVKRAMRQGWRIIKDTVYGFIEDEALSRGAAVAFYTATSIAPVLLIVVAIAGLAFGQDAARSAITGQLSGLMGDQTAQLIQTAVASASKKSRSHRTMRDDLISRSIFPLR